MGIKDMFLDIVCEFLFDLILEGAIAGVASRKVPMIIRVLLAALILVLYGGLIFIIFYIAIKDKSILVGIVGVLMALIVFMAAQKKYVEYKHKKAGEASEQ